MVHQLIVHDKQLCFIIFFIIYYKNRTRSTKKLCCIFLHLYALEFVEPENWPLNSTDLNPVDYSIWGAFQQFTVVVAFETLST